MSLSHWRCRRQVATLSEQHFVLIVRRGTGGDRCELDPFLGTPEVEEEREEEDKDDNPPDVVGVFIVKLRHVVKVHSVDTLPEKEARRTRDNVSPRARGGMCSRGDDKRLSVLLLPLAALSCGERGRAEKRPSRWVSGAYRQELRWDEHRGDEREDVHHLILPLRAQVMELFHDVPTRLDHEFGIFQHLHQMIVHVAHVHRCMFLQSRRGC